MTALAALVAVSLLALAATLIALPILVLVAGVRALARAWSGAARETWDLTRDQLESSVPLVVAVHGTGAPVIEGEPHWARAGTPLHRALAAAIQSACGTAPIWHTFTWSGDNSTTGRLAAVEALTTLVNDATTHDPGRLVVIVGHSHGGNIAAVTAQRLADRPRLRVVTLATPFLTVLARPDTGPLGDLLTLVPGVALSLAAFLVARVAGGWPWSWAGLLLAGALLASAVLAVRLRRRREATLSELPAATLNPADLDALRPRTLIVSRIGDEADAGLRLLGFATNWVVRTVGKAGLVEETASAVARAQAGDGHRSAHGLAGGDALWHGQQVAVFEMAALLSGLFLLSLLQLLAGTSSTLASVALNVGSSETPPGRWHHLQSTWAGAADASLLATRRSTTTRRHRRRGGVGGGAAATTG